MYATAGQDRVDTAHTDLTRDPQLLESAALAVLSEAWAEKSEQDRVRAVGGLGLGAGPGRSGSGGCSAR